ncbi:MAG: nitroreductase family protein [Pseudomonadota bacterium]
MNPVLSAIKERRSVRKFQERPVAQEDLARLLEAVRWSPSWANSQCWEVVVVTDPAQRQALQATLAKGNPATKAVVSAPLLLVLCAKLGQSGYYNGQVTTKFGDWMLYDLGIATQSLSLAAHALGLASVVVGLFDQDQAGKVLSLPEGYQLVSMLPIGYPDQSPKPPARKEIDQFSHYDRF